MSILTDRITYELRKEELDRPWKKGPTTTYLTKRLAEQGLYNLNNTDRFDPTAIKLPIADYHKHDKGYNASLVKQTNTPPVQLRYHVEPYKFSYTKFP